MKVRLKKDILIPAWTVFDDAPHRMEMVPGHIEHIIGLTDDSSGTLIYYLDPHDTELSEWFEPCEQSHGMAIDAVDAQNNVVRSVYYDAMPGG